MSKIKALLEQLIRFPSITPNDAGCQEFMIGFLKDLGFKCQILNQDPVSNFFASLGNQGPLLVFAGHTDVVSVGHLASWNSPPFELSEVGGMLYGRGVADMKGSLAAMLHMAARWVKDYPEAPGRLGFLITSGEEGDDFDLGTPHVMKQLYEKGIQIDYCVVGEPSSEKQIADVMKIGRRGSLTATIHLKGKQGHVAYPHLADNPIHRISPILAELTQTQWDKGNTYFPPTSLQITSIQAGGLASNVIPGDLNLQLNFRYSTEQTDDNLKAKVQEAFQRQQLHPTIHWRLNGKPFLTKQGAFITRCQEAIKQHTGQNAELSTNGGTSDGRFIAPYGVEVIELGPLNATIHQVNECVALKDLDILGDIYYSITKRILLPAPGERER